MTVVPVREDITAVRFADSLEYGVGTFACLAGVTTLGLGAVALGAFRAVPELSSWLDGDGAGQAALAGGVVVLTLGAAVWFAGLFAAARKLLADAVSAGVAHGQGGSTGRLPAAYQHRLGRSGASTERGASRGRRESAPDGGRSEAAWLVGDRGEGQRRPACRGAGEPAQNREGGSDGTAPNQTAEEFASGTARGAVKPATGEEGGTTLATGEPAASSGTSPGDPDGAESATDGGETVSTGTGAQGENEADTAVEPDSGGTAADPGGDGESDLFADRPTNE